MRYSRGAHVKLGVLLLLCWMFTYNLTPLVGVYGYGDGSKTGGQVIASHCSDKCGNVTIPYPFGIQDGCFYEEHNNKGYDSPFKIQCNHSSSPPTPIFGKNVEVLNISVRDAELRIQHVVAYWCFNILNKTRNSQWTSINLESFTLSRTKNALVAVGCNTFARFTGRRNDTNYSSGCMTSCVRLDDAIDGECSGIGCCQSSFSTDAQYINVTVDSFYNHTYVRSFNPCSAAFPVEKDWFRFRRKDLRRDVDYYKYSTKYPVVIDWAVRGKTCSKAKADNTSLCNHNADCLTLENGSGYHCICKPGFQGNAYLPLGHPHGCTDIDECKTSNECEKEEYCVNTNGSYYCKCPKGHHGNGTKDHPCVPNTNPWLKPVLATAGAGGSIITILVIGFLFYWKQEERQLKKTRDSFFRQNGGLLLHEKLSGRNSVDTLKIFTTQDLEKASNNYCDDNIIGRGGFGVVYKGILPNKQIVAIKKSLRVDPSQNEQFIKEVLILSQIKNKDVVKLLGCCLETEVPLLVYEFINNGTLYEHLHDEVKASTLKWPVRLKIASQVASVLKYLHHTTETPIIHRDMKSMNVLLDESYTAKVTDFGASRLSPSDQSQFATMVIGTRGYLDPEYMQKGKLTEKSDVYSFGVVLVELLTREKAISFEMSGTEKYLARHFLVKMRDGCLLDILDKNIVSSDDGAVEQIQQVANLAKRCLMLKGEERPTMKEVSLELEMIERKGSHPWNDDGSSSLQDSESLHADYPRSDDYGG